MCHRQWVAPAADHLDVRTAVARTVVARPRLLAADDPDPEAGGFVRIHESVNAGGHHLIGFRAFFLGERIVPLLRQPGRHERHARIRRIMPVLHPWCLRVHTLLHAAGDDGRIDPDLSAERLGQLLHGDRTWSKQGRYLTGEVEDGRLDTDAHRAVIEDHLDLSLKIMVHMRRFGRARLPGGVRARSGDRYAGRLYKREGHPVLRAADRDGLEATRRFIWHDRRLRHHDRERSRPERFHQLPRAVRKFRNERRDLVDTGDMHDQRIIRWPSLRRIYLPARLRIQCIAPETIDCLGRKCHEATLADDLRRLLHALHTFYDCFHLNFLLSFSVCAEAHPHL